MSNLSEYNYDFHGHYQIDGRILITIMMNILGIWKMFNFKFGVTKKSIDILYYSTFLLTHLHPLRWGDLDRWSNWKLSSRIHLDFYWNHDVRPSIIWERSVKLVEAVFLSRPPESLHSNCRDSALCPWSSITAGKCNPAINAGRNPSRYLSLYPQQDIEYVTIGEHI